MIEIKYVCSNGTEYNLVGDRMRATSGCFHSYEWQPKSTDMEIGTDVYGFTKESVTYKLTLTLRGGLEERKKLSNELTNCFEYDIVNVTPARIYFGNYYIECYIKSGTNTVSSIRNNWTDYEIEIYCPYPFWAEEQTKSFYLDEKKGDEYDYLEYPYGYEYDFSRQESGSQHWYINHYRENNFKMVIYGPCANPRVIIADSIYQVFDTLETNEYIVIDSKKRTVMKYLSNGTVQNIFYKKGTENSIFTLIPSGDVRLNWNGDFGFDITVFKERSVPEWN